MKDGDICQIAEVVTDIEKAMKHLYQDFQIGPWDIYEYGPDFVEDSFIEERKIHNVINLQYVGWVQFNMN